MLKAFRTLESLYGGFMSDSTAVCPKTWILEVDMVWSEALGHVNLSTFLNFFKSHYPFL